MKRIDDYFEDNFREEQDLAYEDKHVAFNNLQKITQEIQIFNERLRHQST